MQPLIRISPSKDGGRRMLTEEAKASLASWLEMMLQRTQRQYEGIVKYVKEWPREMQIDTTSPLFMRMVAIRWLQNQIDCAFDAEEFAKCFDWATEVMDGKPDDTAGDSQDGDAVR